MEISELVKRCVRILYISTKPTGAEYSKVARVTAIGMLLFGLTGFVISAVFRFVEEVLPNMLR
ncbi:MAG: protein translocase SEC61 complex subunit gamma [Candidatus Micrarchaeota archaeon]